MRFIFLIILFTTCSNITFSQHSIGLRLGVFSAKHQYNSNVTSDINVGIEVGILSRLNLYKGIFCQPEITFIQKGGNRQYSTDEYNITTNQLETALLLGYEINIKKLMIFANSGLFAGKVINEKTRGNPFINFNYVDYNDSKTDWGLLFGLGIGMRLGKGKLLIEGRYRKSENRFRTITRGSTPFDTLGVLTLKNKGWGINIGYQYMPTKS